MQTPILVGIHGVKQSGKGTVFHFVKEWGGALGLSAYERGFADNVKWALARLFWPDIGRETAVEWADRNKERHISEIILFSDTGSALDQGRKHVTVRQLLQHMGTEVGRNIFGKNFWVDQLLNPFLAKQDYLDVVAEEEFDLADLCGITDLRFANELERIDQFTRSVTIIVRNEKAERAVIEEAKAQGREVHASELLLPENEFDFVVYNDDTLNTLQKEVNGIMGAVRQWPILQG